MHLNRENICSKPQSYPWKAVLKSNYTREAPSARWGHSMTLANERIFIFGGYGENQYLNDLWEFNIRSSSWRSFKSRGDIPEKRSNHTAIYFKEKDQLIIFGGAGIGKKRYNNIFAFQIDNRSWKQIETTGLKPCSRTYHSAVVLENYMIIFGGENVSDLDDLCILDLYNSEWSMPEITGRKPQKRRFHTASLIGTKMVIFGGCCENYKCLNDMFVIDFERYLKEPSTAKLVWMEINQTGKIPCQRWGHSSFVRNNLFYVFGGRSQTDFNDLHSFSMEKQEWHQVPTDGTIPLERRRQTGVVVGDQFVIFGGFNGSYLNDFYFLDLSNHDIREEQSEEDYSLKKYLTQPDTFDVIFQIEGKEIGAHKIILLLADPGFNNLFSSKLLINETTSRSYIQTDDVKFKYLSGIINYCYSKSPWLINLEESNLGYLLTLRYVARKLNLFEIEKEIDSALIKRSKFKSPPKEKYQEKLIPECPEDVEPITEIKKSVSNDDLLTNLKSNSFRRFITIFQERVFTAHRIILSHSSKYFKNLLRRNFKEGSSTSRAILKEIEEDVFELILLFIYFKKEFMKISVHELQENLWVDLLKSANYFMLSELADFCQEKIAEILSIENVLTLLSFSLDHNCPRLERDCLHFMYKNYHSYNFRKIFIEFIAKEKAVSGLIVQKMKAFCTQMKFSIYQQRTFLRSIESLESNLDDIIYGQELTIPGKPGYSVTKSYDN